MIAKVCLLLTVVAAAQAVGLVGVGAPLLGAGHLGAISAQSTAINHVAPVATIGHGIGPLGLGVGSLGLGVGPLGLGVGPLGLGHGIAGGNLRADGIVGSGILGSRYGSVIGHNAIVHGGVIGHGGVLGLGHGVGLGKAIW